jgi:hypothetical protein
MSANLFFAALLGKPGASAFAVCRTLFSRWGCNNGETSSEFNTLRPDLVLKNSVRVRLGKLPRTGTRIASVIAGSRLKTGEHFVETDDCNPGSCHYRRRIRLRDRATNQNQQRKRGRQHKRSKRSANNACTNADNHAAETSGRSADDAALA